MVKEIIAQVEKYNATVPSKKQLSLYKAFEGSEADVIICKKGTEVFLPGGKAVDITSKKMIWVGLQVKTGSVVLIGRDQHYLQFNAVNGYKALIALLCVNVADHDEAFYFESAPAVEVFSSARKLWIPIKPKHKKKIASIKKLRANHQIKFADLPAKLFQLYERHAKAGTLMSWRDANDPAAKGESTDLQVNSLTSCVFSTSFVFSLVLIIIICPRSSIFSGAGCTYRSLCQPPQARPANARHSRR